MIKIVLRMTEFGFRKLQAVIWSIFVLIGIAIVGFTMLSGSLGTTDEQNVRIFSQLGVVCLLFSIGTWYAVRHEIICPYIIYIVTGYIFMYGQCLVWAFYIPVEHKSLYDRYTDAEILPAQVFTLLCLLALHIGSLLVCKPVADKRTLSPDITKTSEYKRELDLSYKSIKYAGWILFGVSVVPYFYRTITQLIYISTHSYNSALQLEGSSSRLDKLIVFISSYFFISLFLLLIAYQHNRFIKACAISLVAISSLINLYVGNRAASFILILCLICAWHYLIKPIKIKQIIIVIIIFYLVLTMGTVVGAVRNMSGRSLSDYFDAYSILSQEENPVVSLFGEMGWQLSNTVEMTNRIPEQYPFRYGSSYMYSLTTIIPNLGFWDLHPAAVHSNLSDWLQGIMNYHSGPGFSPVAEAFLNFGWFGVFFMVLEGAILGRFLSASNKYSIYYTPENLSLGFAFLLGALRDSVRSSSLTLIRDILYNVIPIILLIIVIKYTINSFERRREATNQSVRLTKHN